MIKVKELDLDDLELTEEEIEAMKETDKDEGIGEDEEA